MRALLLVFLLAWGYASAGTPINVSFTYTTGAAQYASDHSTNVPDMVAAAIGTATTSGMNKNYADSTIPITIVNNGVTAATKAPDDTASVGQQMFYAEYNIFALYARAAGDVGSSIHIQITDPGALAPFDSSVIPGTAGGDGRQAVGVVPIRGLADELERAISRIIAGASYNGGYVTRQNRYSSEGKGDTFCVHTREAGPSSTSVLVPDLSPVWIVRWTGLEAYTKAPTAYISCQAVLPQMVTTGCAPNDCNSAALNPSGNACLISNNVGSIIRSPAMDVTTSAGSHTIVCTDNADNRYSSPSLFRDGKPLGDSTHNDVALLSNSARITQVSNFNLAIKGLLRSAQEASWWQSAYWDAH